MQGKHIDFPQCYNATKHSQNNHLKQLLIASSWVRGSNTNTKSATKNVCDDYS